MSHKNKEIVRKYYEQANNDRDLTVFERCVAEDIVAHFVPEIRGRDKLRHGQSLMLMAFPDLRVTVTDMIAEGDQVAVRNQYKGTFQHDFAGIPATGKHVSWITIFFVTLADGKIVEVKPLSDFFQQPGITAPKPPEQA